MYLIMIRDTETEEKDIVNCLTDEELIDKFFPFGTDEQGRCLKTLKETKDGEDYKGLYLIEIDKNRASLIASLINETVTNYLFENRWR